MLIRIIRHLLRLVLLSTYAPALVTEMLRELFSAVLWDTMLVLQRGPQ